MTGATTMVSVKFSFVVEDVDRHGNVRLYFRRKGQPKVRIHEPLGSPEFVIRYQQLCAGTTERADGDAPRTPQSDTWRWLCTQYFASSRFRGLDSVTQVRRRAILEATCDEPIFPGARETFADIPISRMTPKAVSVLRDRKAAWPTAANNRVKAIGFVFAWAIGSGLDGVATNPVRDVARLRTASTGHHTWTPEEVETFEKRHPIGTKAGLALAIFLCTGVRRSDAVRLGKQHVRDGWLRFKQHKNRDRSPVTIEVPILPELQRIIDASPTGDMTFLVTEHGKPFTANGFGNKFKGWCIEAGLPHCSAHGLRKAGAARAAENGATASELMAIFGWKSIKEAEIYTKAAERKMLAGHAMRLLREGKS